MFVQHGLICRGHHSTTHLLRFSALSITVHCCDHVIIFASQMSSSPSHPAPPGPPTQVTVSQTGPTSVRVSWIPSSGPIIGYYILSGSEGVATYTTASSVVPYFDMTTGSQTNNLITVGARGQYFTSSCKGMRVH